MVLIPKYVFVVSDTILLSLFTDTKDVARFAKEKGIPYSVQVIKSKINHLKRRETRKNLNKSNQYDMKGVSCGC